MPHPAPQAPGACHARSAGRGDTWSRSSSQRSWRGSQPTSRRAPSSLRAGRRPGRWAEAQYRPMVQRRSCRYDPTSWIRCSLTICKTWLVSAAAIASRGSTSLASAARQPHGATDFDLLVEFEDLPADAYADAYFGLLADLEALLQRRIDLVMASAVKNPFVRETIERSRIPLHAAAGALATRRVAESARCWQWSRTLLTKWPSLKKTSRALKELYGAGKSAVKSFLACPRSPPRLLVKEYKSRFTSRRGKVHLSTSSRVTTQLKRPQYAN